jgi:hypothetical protein
VPSPRSNRRKPAAHAAGLFRFRRRYEQLKPFGGNTTLIK